MRISLTYLYAIARYGYPHSVDDALRSLQDVRALGFRFLEMEGLGRDNMISVYARRQELANTLRDLDLHVHNFCVVDPDLVSFDPRVRRRALDGFRQGAEVAELIGADTLHLASYAPPVEYLERAPYQLSADGGYQFENVTTLRVPPDFNWQRVWQALVASCQGCADIASEYGKTVLMEPRVGEVICSVDSLLRLIEHVARPNFKANFDTAHFSAQRENPVLALAKLDGHFANIHIADNDPANSAHLPIGDGIVDWPEFFATLKRMKYEGYLGLDLGPGQDLVEGYRKSVERLQAIAANLDLPLEL